MYSRKLLIYEHVLPVVRYTLYRLLFGASNRTLFWYMYLEHQIYIVAPNTYIDIYACCYDRVLGRF